MDDIHWLDRAVRLAHDNVAEGGGPFGAVVVRGREEIAIGVNRVTADTDPTAHAEIGALRRAAAAIGSNELSGLTLYASCEPCPMCLGAALWARVDRVLYAADRDDAARAGFDDRRFRDLVAGLRDDWPAEIAQRRTPTAVAPFDAWLQREDRIAY